MKKQRKFWGEYGYGKKHYEENKELYIKRAREYRDKYPEKSLLRSAKARAKEKDLEFNLELEDIIIPEKCPLLNCNITWISGKGAVWTNASLDRIDNSKGYIKGNVQIISRLANMMKQAATEEQLITFAENILRIYKK